MADTVQITIIGRDQASAALAKVRGGVVDLGSASTHTGGLLSKLGGSLASLGMAAIKVAAVTAAGALFAFGAALKGGIEDARAHAQVMGQTEQTIKSMGNAAGVSARHVESFAASLSAASGKSLFGDDQIQAATNMLLTFSNIKGATLDLATTLSVDMAQALKSTPEAMSKVVGKILNSADAMSAAQRMGVSFSDEQIKLGKRLFETGHIAEYQALVMKELNAEFGGQAAAAAKADGGWAQFHDRLGEAAETMGTAVLPLLNGLAGVLNDVVMPVVEQAAKLFSDLVTDLSQGGIGTFADDVRELTGIDIMPVVNGINGIVSAVSNVVAAFQEGGIGAGIQALIGTIAGADVQIAAQLVEWGNAFIGWIAPMIPPMLAALSDLLSQALAWVEQQAPIWLQEIQLWGAALIAWVESAIPPLLTELGNLLSQAWAWVQEQAPGWLAQLETWGGQLLAWIGPMIPPLLAELGGLVSQAWAWVQQQAPGWGQQLIAWGQELIAWVGPMIPPALAELSNLASQLFAWVGEQAQPLLAKLGEWAASFVAWIPGAATDFLARWPTIFDRFLTWIGEQAGPLLAKFGEWAIQFVAWIAPKIPDILVALAGVSLAIITWIGETAFVLIKKLVEWGGAFLGWVAAEVLPKLPGILASVLESIGKWIGEAVTWAGRELTKVGDAIVAGIRSGIEAAWGRLVGWFDDRLQELRDKLPFSEPKDSSSPLYGLAKSGKAIIEMLASGVQQAGDVLPQALVGVADRTNDSIGDMIGDIGDQFERSDLADITEAFGQDVMAGLIDGMQSQIAAVQQLVGDIGDQIAGQFSDALDLGSPSRMTYDAGENVMLGLINGIDSLIPALLSQVGGMSADIMDRISQLGDAVHETIADAFDATASIDRQAAKNIDAVGRLARGLQDETQAALDDAMAQAQEIEDPERAAKFFKMRSSQILELARLQDEMTQAEHDGDTQHADELMRQIMLIQDAQDAERRSFDERQQEGTQIDHIRQAIADLFQQIDDAGGIVGDMPAALQQLFNLLNQMNNPGLAAAAVPPQGQGMTAPTGGMGMLAGAGGSVFGQGSIVIYQSPGQSTDQLVDVLFEKIRQRTGGRL